MTSPSTRDLPFWDWLDAGLFIGLAVPSFLAAQFAALGIAKLAPGALSLTRSLLVAQFAMYGLLFAALWLLLKARYRREFWPSMSWQVPWPRMGLTVFMGPLLVLWVVMLGSLLRTPNLDSPMQRLLEDKQSIALVGVFATTLGPLAEELIFRGFFQPLLVAKLGSIVGIAAASLPFALLHGPQYSWTWQHIVLLFMASLTFGIVRHRTGSTAASTMVHATYNLTFFTGFLLQRKELIF